MITEIDEYIRYFDGVARRTYRDILALPPGASGWRPGKGEGEAAWSVNEVVAHIANTRKYMASAYRGEGWLAPEQPDTSDPESWAPLMESSARELIEALRGTPDEWLGRRVRALASEETVVGWRILLMLIEHEVHHRSQIDTYAGINGWEPPQIFARKWEEVMAMQETERAMLSK